MSLFSSIQVGKNALFAAQIGLHVAGNNIANANTPGYVRQDVVLQPAPSQRMGNLLLGLGVEVQGIVQRGDRFLEEQLRGAASDLANGTTQEDTLVQLETLLGELTDTDLSSSLVSFFSRIHDVLNQPEDVSVRNLAVLEGIKLTDEMKRIAERLQATRTDLNNRVVEVADEINQLLSDLARANVQIVTIEGGEATESAAASMRQERSRLLGELAEIMDIKAVEQTSGAVTVFSGGDTLVFEGSARQVDVTYSPDRGMNLAHIELAETKSPLAATSGRLVGLTESRDQIVATLADRLDGFARALAFEFNRVYSGGQGLVGLDELTTEFSVDAVDAPLDDTGLTYTPETGSFQVQVLNKTTGLSETTDVFIHLNGFDDDTTLSDVASALDGISGISTEITPSRQLRVHTDSQDLEFAFRDDTSGVLAALGMNTFFTGTSALNIGVHELVREDPSKFAASRTGIGADTENAVALASFLDSPLASQNGESLAIMYDRLTAETSQATAVAGSVADGIRVFHDALLGKQLGLSGVSLDEEAIRIITFQRAFQAAARFVAAISEVLDVLVKL